MCAIFGIIGEHETSQALSALHSLRHRGTSSNYSTCRELFFGHNLLNINNSTTKQPLHVENKKRKLFITFNGEIYNYKELFKELKLPVTNEIDAIYESYKRWGKSFVQKLKGMFAIAVYDNDTLYLFRDQLGKKPLYYMYEGKRFLFASEIKALKPFLKQKGMSHDALISFLAFSSQVHSQTFYENIFKLPSGHYLEFKNSKIEIFKYYNILDNTPLKEPCDVEKRLEALLIESVNKRVESDIDKALLLSGGLDSSLLASIAKRQSRNLHAYSLGYEDHKKYDESAHATEVASFLGLEHSVLKYKKEDFINDIDELFLALDEPLNDPAALPLNHIFKNISNDGYKVTISGEGSDELFFGYRQYLEYYEIEKLGSFKHKNWLKNYFKSYPTDKREWEWYKRVFNNELLFRGSNETFNDLQLNKLLKGSAQKCSSYNLLKQYYEEFLSSKYSDFTSWYSYIDIKLHLGEYFLNKLDKISMKHTIEARTPYLDIDLINYGFSLPLESKFSENETKPLLKKVAYGYLPKNIVERKKKGFAYPYIEWLYESNSLQLIKDVNKKTSLFNDTYIEQLLQGAKKGAFKGHIYALYNLSHWLRNELL